MDGVEDAEEFGGLVVNAVEVGFKLGGGCTQDEGVGLRPNREAMVMVAEPEGAGFALEEDLAGLKDFAVKVFKDWKEQSPFKGALDGVPVNVEEARPLRLRAVFEDVKQVRVRGGEAHMIGNDVKDAGHPATFQQSGQAVEGKDVANFGVDACVVDDVVAVSAAGSRGEEGGEVEVGDAERGEVVNNRDDVFKTEGVMELEAIGRGGTREGRFGGCVGHLLE